jgi:phosphomannomutase
MPITNRPVGKESERDLLTEYVDYLISLFPEIGDSKTPQRKLKVVIDAGNGMAGHTAPAVMALLNVDVIPMYFELDGNFPNHEANPIDPKNLIDLQKRVLKEKADIGLAFDGDADRCFLIDEKGALVNPSALTGLIAVRELKRKPGSTIIYNLISSKAVPEIITENGGTPLRSRVGHSFIKKMMADSGAIFGGEHSGHFYFADFWRADSGMLAALFALTELASGKSSLSTLLKPFNRYSASGEINSEVTNVPATIEAILTEYGDSNKGFEVDDLDGITVTGPKFWFNVRASNTEPLLRLNVEGDTEAQMIKARDALLAIIRAKR